LDFTIDIMTFMNDTSKIFSFALGWDSCAISEFRLSVRIKGETNTFGSAEEKIESGRFLFNRFQELTHGTN
jgi:hypothetical protein